MKILLDHCLPRRLKREISPHVVLTAADMGWEGLRNGKLLAAAGAQFDVFLTIDKNLKYEQNLNTLPISVVVIMAPSNRLPDILPFLPAVQEALKTLSPKTLVEVFLPPP